MTEYDISNSPSIHGTLSPRRHLIGNREISNDIDDLPRSTRNDSSELMSNLDHVRGDPHGFTHSSSDDQHLHDEFDLAQPYVVKTPSISCYYNSLEWSSSESPDRDEADRFVLLPPDQNLMSSTTAPLGRRQNHSSSGITSYCSSLWHGTAVKARGSPLTCCAMYSFLLVCHGALAGYILCFLATVFTYAGYFPLQPMTSSALSPDAVEEIASLVLFPSSTVESSTSPLQKLLTLRATDIQATTSFLVLPILSFPEVLVGLVLLAFLNAHVLGICSDSRNRLNLISCQSLAIAVPVLVLSLCAIIQFHTTETSINGHLRPAPDSDMAHYPSPLTGILSLLLYACIHALFTTVTAALPLLSLLGDAVPMRKRFSAIGVLLLAVTLSAIIGAMLFYRISYSSVAFQPHMVYSTVTPSQASFVAVMSLQSTRIHPAIPLFILCVCCVLATLVLISLSHRRQLPKVYRSYYDHALYPLLPPVLSPKAVRVAPTPPGGILSPIAAPTREPVFTFPPRPILYQQLHHIYGTSLGIPRHQRHQQHHHYHNGSNNGWQGTHNHIQEPPSPAESFSRNRDIDIDSSPLLSTPPLLNPHQQRLPDQPETPSMAGPAPQTAAASRPLPHPVAQHLRGHYPVQHSGASSQNAFSFQSLCQRIWYWCRPRHDEYRLVSDWGPRRRDDRVPPHDIGNARGGHQQAQQSYQSSPRLENQQPAVRDLRIEVDGVQTETLGNSHVSPIHVDGSPVDKHEFSSSFQSQHSPLVLLSSPSQQETLPTASNQALTTPPAWRSLHILFRLHSQLYWTLICLGNLLSMLYCIYFVVEWFVTPLLIASLDRNLSTLEAARTALTPEMLPSTLMDVQMSLETTLIATQLSLSPSGFYTPWTVAIITILVCVTCIAILTWHYCRTQPKTVPVGTANDDVELTMMTATSNPTTTATDCQGIDRSHAFHDAIIQEQDYQDNHLVDQQARQEHSIAASTWPINSLMVALMVLIGLRALHSLGILALRHSSPPLSPFTSLLSVVQPIHVIVILVVAIVLAWSVFSLFLQVFIPEYRGRALYLGCMGGGIAIILFILLTPALLSATYGHAYFPATTFDHNHSTSSSFRSISELSTLLSNGQRPSLALLSNHVIPSSTHMIGPIPLDVVQSFYIIFHITSMSILLLSLLCVFVLKVLFSKQALFLLDRAGFPKTNAFWHNNPVKQRAHQALNAVNDQSSLTAGIGERNDSAAVIVNPSQIDRLSLASFYRSLRQLHRQQRSPPAVNNNRWI